jgi:L-asparagine transporter-like permease
VSESKPVQGLGYSHQRNLWIDPRTKPLTILSLLVILNHFAINFDNRSIINIQLNIIQMLVIWPKASTCHQSKKAKSKKQPGTQNPKTLRTQSTK